MMKLKDLLCPYCSVVRSADSSANPRGASAQHCGGDTPAFCACVVHGWHCPYLAELPCCTLKASFWILSVLLSSCCKTHLWHQVGSYWTSHTQCLEVFQNTSNILVLGTAWGTGQVVYSGGEEACLQQTLHHGAVHHKNGRMWIVNTYSHCIQSLAFSTDAEDPAGTL